jgi:hypothetical protein
VLVRIVLWSLADSRSTIERMRRHLHDESVDAFADAEGLRLRLWLSDESTDRWGAVELWESRDAADRAPPDRAAELIGKPPDVVEEFDLEASVEGRFLVEQLSRLGLAFEA